MQEIEQKFKLNDPQKILKILDDKCKPLSCSLKQGFWFSRIEKPQAFYLSDTLPFLSKYDVSELAAQIPELNKKFANKNIPDYMFMRLRFVKKLDVTLNTFMDSHILTNFCSGTQNKYMQFSDDRILLTFKSKKYEGLVENNIETEVMLNRKNVRIINDYYISNPVFIFYENCKISQKYQFQNSTIEVSYITGIESIYLEIEILSSVYNKDCILEIQQYLHELNLPGLVTAPYSYFDSFRRDNCILLKQMTFKEYDLEAKEKFNKIMENSHFF